MSDNPLSKLLPWVGVFMICLGAASTSGVALWRIDAQADELLDHSENIDEMEEDIELIQRQLIQRQGEVEIRTQRIEIEQRQQGEQLDEAILLLQQLLANQGANR